MNGQFDEAIETDVEQPPYVTVLALLSLRRNQEALGRSAGEGLGGIRILLPSSRPSPPLWTSSTSGDEKP